MVKSQKGEITVLRQMKNDPVSKVFLHQSLLLINGEMGKMLQAEVRGRGLNSR